MEHRAQAQVISGITEAQKQGLTLGRTKGTNHRVGYKHREESKRKASISHKAWCAANPDKVQDRGKKTRGENHYRWNGGSSRLNISIRQLTEHRKWMDAIRERDSKCRQCGRADCLESHHVVPLSKLIRKNRITNREQARLCVPLWDLSNGVALCTPCHYLLHGRHYAG